MAIVVLALTLVGCRNGKAKPAESSAPGATSAEQLIPATADVTASAAATAPEPTPTASVPSVTAGPPQAPTITALTPASGPTTGGTTVTITGTGFTGTKKVVFGDLDARSFTVISDTRITAITPPEPPGTHKIYVTTPGGKNAATPTHTFTFTAPVPTITALTPASGPTTGGTTVTITGTGFTGTKKVVFGDLDARSFTVISDTRITAITPPEPPGTHNVYVTTPGGRNVAGGSDRYDFIAGTTPPKTTG